MRPWLRQGIWLAAALVVPVLLSLVLLPLRAHVSDVLIALILLTVSAAAVARGELLLSLVAATSTALSFDYFFTAPYDQYAGELAERQRQVEQLAAELTASRRRILAVGDQMRHRIERDLHDGVQQHLVSLSLMLRGIRDRASVDVRADVDEVCDRLAGTIEELRDLSRGLHPAILVEAGLGPAVRALARRSPLPVRVQVQADGRLPGSCEATAYYVAAEAFTNAAKHAAASAVDILTMTLDSPARAGTVLTVRLPVTAEDHLSKPSRPMRTPPRCTSRCGYCPS
jgi:signal transduction histidine kinase